jgi:transposase
VICLDEMGPERAKSHPGVRVVARDTDGKRRPRATQEIDYGRAGAGYTFGAFRPATGDAFTAPYDGRTIANWCTFLEAIDGWVGPDAERVYAILDNLSTHRAIDVLLWALAHPRWEFVFQPTYAAYLNLIEPWWKVLRSLALKGRRFATRADVDAAIAAATVYWNAHRHPFVWGQRKRWQAARATGIAQLPVAA